MNSQANTIAAVPNSSGTSAPKLKAPANACDSHIHIVDGRFPASTPIIQGGTVPDYRLLQQRIGTTRTVIVQPKNFGTDNTCTLDAIAQLGIANARGIAVVHPSVTDEQLRVLDAGGIRGLRFSIWNPADTVTTVDMIEPLAKRIQAFGWHVQLHMSSDQLVANAALFDRLPCPMVIDHMGRMPAKLGPKHLAFGVICRLIEKGRTWVKLSGAYLNTESGPPAYADATVTARAFSQYAPERIVWGSDWPHVTEKEHKPDDALLFDLLEEWIPGEKARRLALSDNPSILYGFA